MIAYSEMQYYLGTGISLTKNVLHILNVQIAQAVPYTCTSVPQKA